MKDSQPHLALREMRAHFSQGAPWVVVAGVAIILALAGPFETDEVMRLVPRIAYWGVLVTASYGCGFFVAEILRAPLSGLPFWARGILSGLATSIGVAAVVLGVNYAALNFMPAANQMLGFIGPIVAISITVSTVFEYIGSQSPSNATPNALSSTPALLDRLSFDKRGALIWLSVQDHYVNVVTSKGAEMLLMRLGDAIKETGGTPGLQVHRSHWVALDHITVAKREGDRAMLTLSTGNDVPVSRTYVPAIRDAGFL